MKLLRLPNERQRKCFSTYDVDTFYYLPVPALNIIRSCQSVCRNRLLHRDEMMDAVDRIRCRIELRRIFKFWSKVYFVRKLKAFNILKDCLNLWRTLCVEKAALRLFNKVNQRYIERQCSKLFFMWRTLFILRKHRARLELLRKKQCLSKFQEYTKISKMKRRSTGILLKQYFSLWLFSKSGMLDCHRECLKLIQKKLQRNCFQLWFATYKKFESTKEKSIVLRKKQKHACIKYFWEQWLQVYRKPKLAISVERINSPMRDKTHVHSPIKSPKPLISIATPLKTPPRAKETECRCIGQINRIGMKCISCSKQEHYIRRLKTCHSVVDGAIEISSSIPIRERKSTSVNNSVNGSISASLNSKNIAEYGSRNSSFKSASHYAIRNSPRAPLTGSLSSNLTSLTPTRRKKKTEVSLAKELVI